MAAPEGDDGEHPLLNLTINRFKKVFYLSDPSMLFAFEG